MSLDLQAESLDVKLTGRTVYVPENKIAKLMYYLDCVTGVIQYDRNSKLLEYQDYYLLSEEEEEMVVTLAILFDPKIFIDKKLFLVGPEYVLPGSTNQFYQITNNKFGIHVSSEVIIGGVSRKILQFMGCKNSWLEGYYYEPLRDYLDSHPNFLQKKNVAIQILAIHFAIVVWHALILVASVAIVVVAVVVKKFVVLFFGEFF